MGQLLAMGKEVLAQNKCALNCTAVQRTVQCSAVQYSALHCTALNIVQLHSD
jgi:hypothetical protein